MRLDIITANLGRRRDLPLALLVAATVAAYGLAPTGNGQVTCLLRLHADHACPGCGMSRATGRLLRGDVAAAFAYHPWVFAFLAQAIGFAAWRYHWGNRPMEPKHRLWLVWSVTVNVSLLFVVWGVRIATGHLDNVY